MSIGDVLLAIGWVAFGVFCAFMVYVLFVVMPVALYTHAECLRNGYPKHAVSVDLQRYCMNLDGTVTVKVDKLK